MRPSLDDLRAFVAVATRRSFRRAADDLGLAPSTLSHTIRGLEEQLGLRLLNRSTRSVSPTEAGFTLLEHLQTILAMLDQAIDATVVAGNMVSGRVRISAPRITAASLVRDVLPTMSLRYPEVSVDIVAEGRLIDVVSEGYDAGSRFSRLIPKDMVAVPYGDPVEFVCVASPAYLRHAGEPSAPDELVRHRCIAHRLPSGKLLRWIFERAGQEMQVSIDGRIVLDDEDLMIEAAKGGMGIAYVSSWAAATALDEGAVLRVLSPWTPQSERVAIYFPGHRVVPPSLRAFLDVVRETAKYPRIQLA